MFIGAYYSRTTATKETLSFFLLVLLVLATCSVEIIAKPASYALTPDQISTFRRDGVLVIRGLLSNDQLTKAIKAAGRIQRSQTILQRIFYHFFPSYRSLQFQTWRNHAALESVAFDSAAPTICASLMGLSKGNDDSITTTNSSSRQASSPRRRSVRLLKDAVLGFGRGDSGCGWHVDDRTFWPCEDSERIGRQPDAGINVWITLSPVSAAEGGGLAVAPGTHKARFAKHARATIASRGQQTTCFLEQLDPKSHEHMEQRKMVYDLQPGDAIIHDRYIFHRADPFVEDDEHRGSSSSSKKNNHRRKRRRRKDEIKHRISLRYVPDDAVFYNDHDRERVVHMKGMDTGDVIAKGEEYYPQTWPDSLPAERGKRVLSEKSILTVPLLFRFLKRHYTAQFQMTRKARMSSVKRHK